MITCTEIINSFDSQVLPPVFYAAHKHTHLKCVPVCVCVCYNLFKNPASQKVFVSPIFTTPSFIIYKNICVHKSIFIYPFMHKNTHKKVSLSYMICVNMRINHIYIDTTQYCIRVVDRILENGILYDSPEDTINIPTTQNKFVRTFYIILYVLRIYTIYGSSVVVIQFHVYKIQVLF